MTRRFATFALPAELVSVAFPLVSAAIPALDLAGWKKFVRPMIKAKPPGPEGVIGLQNESGHLCGLVVYQIARDLANGVTFAIDLFVALDLVNEIAAARALLQAAEARALELGCTAVQIRLGLEGKALAQCVNANGYRSSACLYLKEVSQPLIN